MRLAPWFLPHIGQAVAAEAMREMDVRLDLVGVTELVGLAFRDELRHAGRNPQEELWMVKRSMPVVWLLATVSPQFRRAFLGFVWIADRRVVGNVSLTRVDRSSRHWMIGNVAVHPDYRRRGIARRLTERALAYCREHGAERVSLEVRRGNEPARRLYDSMGFRNVDSTTKYEIVPVPDVAPPLGQDIAVRPLHPRDIRLVRRLKKIVEQRICPVVDPGAELLTPRDWIEYALGYVNGTAGLTWVAERDGVVLGTVAIAPGLAPIRRLRFLVHPTGRGIVEPLLVAAALRALRGRRARVRAEVQTDYTELIDALDAFRFQPIETLDRMILDCKSQC